MSKICPSCKLRYDDTSMFCAECGAVLVNEQPAQYTEEASPQYSPQPQYAVSVDQAQYTAPETQPLYQYQQQYRYAAFCSFPALLFFCIEANRSFPEWNRDFRDHFSVFASEEILEIIPCSQCLLSSPWYSL